MTMFVTLGEILVEFVAVSPGAGFQEPVELVGPFASGAPAIFIDQVARLGEPCAIVGCVGDDDFGRLNLERMRRDGVDTRAVEMISGYPTGTAFVRYQHDGGRRFVHNIEHSAAGRLRLTGMARSLLREATHLHVSGASLFSQQATEVVFESIEVVKAHGATVSFDPNLRSEALHGPQMFSPLSALGSMLSKCDIFLPSGDELEALLGVDNVQEAIGEVLGRGAKEVVLKQGRLGATHYGPNCDATHLPAYSLETVDATGAGDCFDATYLVCRAQGRSVSESLDFANAAGAMAIVARGPMEGTSNFAQLDALRHQSQASEGHQSGRGQAARLSP